MRSILPLFLFVAIATLTPGGATMLATASGGRFGFVRSIPLMLGIALALASLAAVAALGLGRLLLAMPVLQTTVKALGSAYLLWLAWRIARSGRPNAGNASNGPARPTTLIGGFLLLWLNPKSWAMTVGAAASFTLLASSPSQLALLLGTAFGLAACISLALWCALGMLLARILRTPLHWRILNLAMGTLLAASVIPTWT
jgi:threonine/homoserine/homoserine lactone efflux protein